MSRVPLSGRQAEEEGHQKDCLLYTSGIVLMIGIVLLAMGGSPWVLGLGIGLFAVTTAFAFITLPVEFDASARDLKWLDRSHRMNYFDHGKAKSCLLYTSRCV